MTLKEFAKMLSGREYGNEITKAEEQLAKELGYVVVFGYSDDCIELRGAIDDEIDSYGSGEIGHELLPDAIYAHWSPDDIDCAWAFETCIPHEEFNVFEGEELYCVGIVCDINKKPMTNGERINTMSNREKAELIAGLIATEHARASAGLGHELTATQISAISHAWFCTLYGWLNQPVGGRT